MLQTFEAIIDENGVLRVLDNVDLPKMRKVILTVLNEEPTQDALKRISESQKIYLLEQKHAQGYAKFPPDQDDLNDWESIQDWGDNETR
jgi:predicted DNA-binding antitoxin AbrB/MazE fold protein